MMTLTCAGANIIAQWDFNSLASDASSSTGTILPYVGNGYVTLVGGANANFGVGSARDPVGTGNSAWNTSSYAQQGTNNKTAGTQFSVSTAGYSSIVISWDHKVSSSASKYCRFQYSVDGLHFSDYPQPIVSTNVFSNSSQFETKRVDLAEMSDVNDNPNFVFRIVSEFESTAMGAGAEAYVTTYSTNNYSRSGSIRLDMVTVTGSRIPGGNTTPFLASIAPVRTLAEVPTEPIAVAVDDYETPPDELDLSAVSTNPALIPNTSANIQLGGAGTTRILTLVPARGQTGVAPISLTLSDATHCVSSVFPVIVVPSPSILFCDSFSYPNGPLLPNSAFLWGHRAGVFGQCEITNGALQITSSQTEDVVVTLAASPYKPGSNAVLYAAFQATFLTLPKLAPEYFAHFGDGNILRARIYVGTSNALPGCFRLFVGNGSDSNVMLPWNLHTNLAYTLITRYAIDSATTTLWINPAVESDPGTTARDALTPVSVSSYGFRQDAGLGSTVLVDDFRVGLSFASVVTMASQGLVPLKIEYIDGEIVLRWADSGVVLQTAYSPGGPFDSLLDAKSPYTNQAAAISRFYRLNGR
jgi:hypothetical protein